MDGRGISKEQWAKEWKQFNKWRKAQYSERKEYKPWSKERWEREFCWAALACLTNEMHGQGEVEHGYYCDWCEKEVHYKKHFKTWKHVRKGVNQKNLEEHERWFIVHDNEE